MSAPPRTPLDPTAQGEERTEPSPGHCLSDDEVAAFAQGQLAARERGRVEEHADGCSVCAALLHEAMRALNTILAPSGGDASSEFATTFSRDTLVGERYEIKRFIARGGMGEVYEAYDRHLQERVALKTVSSTASDNPRAIRDLKAEVQIARRVTHAHVCRIYDLGTHVLNNNGVVHFLTMEFVEGETLGQILRAHGALGVAQCDRFARALLQALAAAHSAGILHRDFKSDNVMVRRQANGELSPVILDFGLARHLDERSRARSSGQAMVGTLSYMAPEQVEGGALSRATDIYAFGVVWFEMLTGKIPFAGSPQMSALERLTKAPNAPSVLNREVSKRIDAAVLRCLARQPEQRFQSAQEVLTALDANLSGHAPPAVRPAVRALQLGAAAVLFGGGVYAFARNEPREPKVSLTVAPALASSATLGVSQAAQRVFGLPLASATLEKAPVAAALQAVKAPKNAPVHRDKLRPALSSATTAPSAPQEAPAPSTSAAQPEKRVWPFGRSPLEQAPNSQNRTQ